MDLQSFFSDYALTGAMILLVICIAGVVIFPIIQSFGNPRMLFKPLIGLVVLVVLYFVGQGIGAGRAVSTVLVPDRTELNNISKTVFVGKDPGEIESLGREEFFAGISENIEIPAEAWFEEQLVNMFVNFAKDIASEGAEMVGPEGTVEAEVVDEIVDEQYRRYASSDIYWALKAAYPSLSRSNFEEIVDVVFQGSGSISKVEAASELDGVIEKLDGPKEVQVEDLESRQFAGIINYGFKGLTVKDRDALTTMRDGYRITRNVDAGLTITYALGILMVLGIILTELAKYFR